MHERLCFFPQRVYIMGFRTHRPKIRHICTCVRAKSYSTPCDTMDWQPARLLHSRDSPVKNTEVGSHSLLQGICPTQGSDPHLHISYTSRQILDHCIT